jgi:cell division cycle protein 37
MFQAIMQAAAESENDAPPPPPAGVHTEQKEALSYSKMMSALVDQVKAKVVEDKA